MPRAGLMTLFNIYLWLVNRMVTTSKFSSGGIGSDREIDFLDIIKLLISEWKKLVTAALLGALLGLGSWFFLGSYQAQLTLTNNEGISVLSLRSLQQSLPNLAAEILERGSVPEGKEVLFSTMSNPDWWKKALTPVFSLTKSDIKELGADLKEGSNTLIFLKVSAAAKSQDGAIQNIRDITNFVRQGAAFLAIESLIRSQRAALISSEADIDGKINSAQVELTYQQVRLKNLEALAKRFPGEVRANPQVVDPKDSGAKYMPISTQIIAVNTDINNATENLERLRDNALRLIVLRKWLANAEPMVAGAGYDGLKLNEALLGLEERQRADVGNDPKSLAYLYQVRNALLENELRFKLGLLDSGPISVKKPGMIKAVVGGSVGALFLMLLALFWIHFLANRVFVKRVEISAS